MREVFIRLSKEKNIIGRNRMTVKTKEENCRWMEGNISISESWYILWSNLQRKAVEISSLETLTGTRRMKNKWYKLPQMVLAQHSTASFINNVTVKLPFLAFVFEHSVVTLLIPVVSVANYTPVFYEVWCFLLTFNATWVAVFAVSAPTSVVAFLQKRTQLASASPV